MDIKCLQCNKKVYGVTKRRKFCSQKCADARRYIPKPKKGKWLNCLYCGKKAWTSQWRLKFKRRFCNREHQLLSYKKEAFNKNCIICNKKFYCQPCQIKYRHRQTCSITCRSKLKTLRAKENRIKNGFTKHQIDRSIRYSKEAQDWRKKVFERDDYTCQHCKVKGGYLEADHIKPFAYFSELRFIVSNGRTLCRKCHDKTKMSAKEMRKLYAHSKKDN